LTGGTVGAERVVDLQLDVRAALYGPLVIVDRAPDFAPELHAQRERLQARLEQDRTDLAHLQLLAAQVQRRIDTSLQMLSTIAAALGEAPQLDLDDLTEELRGQRLERVALDILTEEHGVEAEVHYREWYELVRAHGYRISGRDPVATFLAQINRCKAVEAVGRRSGRYRLRPAERTREHTVAPRHLSRAA
jgi:hypothetical protein